MTDTPRLTRQQQAALAAQQAAALSTGSTPSPSMESTLSGTSTPSAEHFNPGSTSASAEQVDQMKEEMDTMRTLIESLRQQLPSTQSSAYVPPIGAEHEPHHPVAPRATPAPTWTPPPPTQTSIRTDTTARYHPSPFTRYDRQATIETQDHYRPGTNRIKSSELPKFGGKDTDDVDAFLEKVSAIYEYSHITEEELLRHLPLILTGQASTWFTQLGTERRKSLQHWDDWKNALRNAFYLPDHIDSLRRQCQYRHYKATETISEYFNDKQSLQRYLYSPGTPDTTLIQDMIMGLPSRMKPFVKAMLRPDTTLEDFRRILIDLEPAFRMSPTSKPATQYGSKWKGSTGSTTGTKKAFIAQAAKPSTYPDRPPPSPCPICQGNHWKRTCPKNPSNPAYKGHNTPRTNLVRLNPDTSKDSTRNHTIRNKMQHKPSTPVTNTVTTHSNRRHIAFNGEDHQRLTEEIAKKFDKVNLEEEREQEIFWNPVEPSFQPPKGLPKEPRPQAEKDLVVDPYTTLSQSHQDKTPAHATIRFLMNPDNLHRACIDSGSSISLMDRDFQQRHLPFATVEYATSFMLEGIGERFCSSWIEVDISFVMDDKESVKYPVAFYLTRGLTTQVIIGNDFLQPQGACINLDQMVMTLRDNNLQIPINCFAPEQLDPYAPIVRIKEAFTVKPGHEARIPATVSRPPITEFFVIDPVSLDHSSLHTARSVHRSEAPVIYVHIINVGNHEIDLNEGQAVGIPLPTIPYHHKQNKRILSNMVAFTKAPTEFNEVLDSIDINPDLGVEEIRQIKQILQDNHQAFAYGKHSLGNADLAVMEIDTGDAKPISQPPYHASPNGRKIIQDQLAQLLSEDVIEESDSPWAAPAILVRQKGKDRFCIDYRKLNEVTKADQYPLPRIDDILSQFSGNNYFTTFDANKGFNQIKVAEQDRPKTAFRTHQGLHQYKRMPFGLKNGPSVFQRFMDHVLGRYKWQCVLVYIDDIIVYSPDFDQHLKDVNKVLSLIVDSGLTLSPSKSHIAYQTIKALGHSISNLGIGTNDEAVKAVKEFPIPRNVHELKRFLGLAVYYRRFIQDFSIIATPLHLLLKKDKEWAWTEEQSKSFDKIKDELISAPLLVHPNYEKPFYLYTDASNYGLGAVLSQKDDEEHEHPIVYLSRSLTPAEHNYTATELECLAIIWAVKKLHSYLDGSTFTLITDHSALQWLFDFKGTNRRILRWAMELQPYRDHMTIKYRPGRVNANADPLSRAPLPYDSSDEDEEIPRPSPPNVPTCLNISTSQINDQFKKELIEGYRHDPTMANIIDKLKGNLPSLNASPFDLTSDGIVIYNQPDQLHYRICVPDYKRLRLDILHDHHDSKIAGHLGTSKTLALIANRYYWHNMNKDIKDYVRSCSSCQRNKSYQSKPIGFLSPLEIPPYRWHTVTMDFAGPFVPSGEGKWDSVLIVVEKISRRTHFIPNLTTDKAPTVARRFFNEIVRLHGMPSVIVTDRDARFASMFWTTLMKNFGVKLAMSTAYHPQTDGQSERMVRTFKEMLRHYISNTQHDWVDHLPSLEFAYNNSLNPTTGFTPFELDIGYHPASPHTISAPDPRNVAASEEFKENLSAMLIVAQDSIKHAQELQMRYYDEKRQDHQFKIGDLVALSTLYIYPPGHRTKGSRKLRAKYIGPFKILGKLGPNAYRIDLPAHLQVHPVINATYLKPYVPSPIRFADREELPPPPIVDPESNELEYFVERIVNHRRTKRGKLEYLTHWLGYPDYEDTWQSVESLKGHENLIKDYRYRTNWQEPQKTSSRKKTIMEPPQRMVNTPPLRRSSRRHL